EAWPDVLRAPPWREKKRRSAEDIVLDITPFPTPFAYPPGATKRQATYGWARNQAIVLASLADLPDRLAELEKTPRWGWQTIPAPASPLPKPDAPDDEALAWLAQRLTQLTRETRWAVRNYAAFYYSLDLQPAPLALMLWELTGPILHVGVH